MGNHRSGRWFSRKGLTTEKGASRFLRTLDNIFDVYIKLRDTMGGMARCATCSSYVSYDSACVARYIGKPFRPTRYNEKNAHAVCKECKKKESVLSHVHAVEVDRRHGDGTAARIASMSTAEDGKYNGDWYRLRIKKYRRLANELIKLKSVT